MILLYIAITLGAIIAAFAAYLLIVAVVPGFSAPEQRLEKTGQLDQDTDARRSGSREDVIFEVKGTSLSAWLYLPEKRSTPVPCIIMGHGLGGTKDAGLELYALRFQEAGFAVLAFDYRHLGDSGGEPRQLVWIPYQQEDYTAAVGYARGRDEIDPERIALWGTSLSGGHVIVTAARDSKIACVSAQCPLLDGRAASMVLLKKVGIGPALRMMPHGQRDLVRSWLGLSPHKIPIAGKPGSIALLADWEAWDGFGKLAPVDFINEVCARIVIRLDKYRPLKQAASVRCPVLLQVGEQDIGITVSVIEKAERRLGQLAEVIRYPIGHFDIYQGENFEKAVSDQIAFFKKHL
jgi:fermentation-respiration switch protein FrsA (DUF1100 family)